MSNNREENDFSCFYERSNADYEEALAEISAGRKYNHWIWYIFPQLEILGRSGTAVYFGIKNINEALQFLNDIMLGPRLIEISKVAVQKLNEGVPLNILMGSSVDALKLRSCATLFYYATQFRSKEHNALFKELLELCISQLDDRSDERSSACCLAEIQALA